MRSGSLSGFCRLEFSHMYKHKSSFHTRTEPSSVPEANLPSGSAASVRTDGELPEPPHLERGLHKHHGRRFRLFTPDFATPPYLRLQGRPRWDPAFGPTPTVAQRGHHQLRDQANEVTENDSAVRRRVQTQPRRDAALGIEVAKSQKCEH